MNPNPEPVELVDLDDVDVEELQLDELPADPPDTELEQLHDDTVVDSDTGEDPDA